VPVPALTKVPDEQTAPAVNPRLLNPNAIPGQFEFKPGEAPKSGVEDAPVAPVQPFQYQPADLGERPAMPQIQAPNAGQAPTMEEMLKNIQGGAGDIGGIMGPDAYGDMEKYLKGDMDALRAEAPSDKIGWNDLARFGFSWGSSGDAGKAALAAMDYKAAQKDKYRDQVRDNIKSQTDIQLARQALMKGNLSMATDLYMKGLAQSNRAQDQEYQLNRDNFNLQSQLYSQDNQQRLAASRDAADFANRQGLADAAETRADRRQDRADQRSDDNALRDHNYRLAEQEARSKAAIEAAKLKAAGKGASSGLTASQINTVSRQAQAAAEKSLGIGAGAMELTEAGRKYRQLQATDPAAAKRLYDQEVRDQFERYRILQLDAGSAAGADDGDTDVFDVSQ